MNFLLLRGLTRETRHWHLFPEKLREKFPQSEILLLDLPGVGTEHQRRSPWTIPSIMEDVRARWLAQRKSAENWCLVSISMGGMVALSWCQTHPKEFSRLILINSSISNLSLPFERMRIQSIPQILRCLFTDDAVAREKAILQLTTRLQKTSPAIAERWASFLQECPVTRQTFFAQLFAASSFRARRDLKIPLLVMTSSNDQLCHPRCSRKISEHFDAPILFHPKAGHDLPLDDPDWVAHEIQRWIHPPLLERVAKARESLTIRE